MPRTHRTNRRLTLALVLSVISALTALAPGHARAFQSQTADAAGLVLDSVKIDPSTKWNVSGDGRSASTDISTFGHQAIEFPAPAAVPPSGATFTMTLTANATVSNLATECEVHPTGFIASATPGLHAAAFSEAPGKSNTVTVTINLKPASTAPGATADLQVGCFSFFSVHFIYKSAAPPATSTTTTTLANTCGVRRWAASGRGQGQRPTPSVVTVATTPDARQHLRSQATAAEAPSCGIGLRIVSPVGNSLHASVQPGTNVQLQADVSGYPTPFTVILKFRANSSGPFFPIPGSAYRCPNPRCLFTFGYLKPNAVEFQAAVLIGSKEIDTSRDAVFVSWVSPDKLVFNYSVPDRYGLDENNDGLVDEMTDQQVKPVDWLVDLDVEQCPDPNPKVSTYEWKYAAAGGVAKVLPATWTSKCTWRAKFPGPGTPGVTSGEGAFEVSLKVDVKPPDEHHYVGNRQVIVQDWLVLGLGDSLASGEGNPVSGTGAAALWQNRQCDRSQLSYQALVARKLETSDNKTSVTFVHLACSGAKIADHSIARTRNDNNIADGGLLDPYVGVNPGPVLPSQVDEAKRRVDRREVDAILLSIGVNDLEFGPVIIKCAHAGVTHGKTTGADCFTLPYTSNARAMFASMVLFLRFTVAGELPGLFKTLNARLVSTFGAPFPKGAFPTDRVFIPDYPDTLRSEAGTPCTELDLSATGITEDRWDGWVRTEEVLQLGTEFLGPLNSVVASTGSPITARKPFSWSSIAIVGPSGEGFATRGYCSTDRWVRQRDESFTLQDNQNGSLHPNEAGHRWIADAVYTVVHAKLYPGGTARLPVK